MLRRRFIQASLCLLGAASLTGCSFYYVTSDSVAEESLESAIVGKKVLILPQAPTMTPGDLVFKKTAQAVAEVFQKHQAVVVSSEDEAPDYVARITFGLGNGASGMASTVTPIYGQTSSTTYLPGGGVARTTGYGQVGAIASTRAYSLHQRWFAMRLTTADGAREIWQTSMKSEGSSNSFLAVLPAFMKTLDSRFAKNSSGEEDSWM